jgi:hypothetical protein
MILEINTTHHYKFLCPCIATWEHLASTLWMKIADFIFQFLHIHNCPTLSVLTPFRLPYTFFADCSHLFIDCENTCGDYTNFSTNSNHNFDDCASTLDDWTNIIVDLVNISNISSVDFHIPNFVLLPLLLFCRSKKKLCSLLDLWSVLYLHHSSYVVSIFDILHHPPLC